jgi:transposase
MPKRYETEFKEEIVSLYEDGGRSAKSLANELGLHENTIYKWAEQYRQDPENAFPGSGHMKPEQDELRRAQRRIKELETENDILKKAAACPSGAQEPLRGTSQSTVCEIRVYPRTPQPLGCAEVMPNARCEPQRLL